MIDTNKLIEALGGEDGEIHAVTEWEDVRIVFVGGAVRMSCAPRKPISREDIEAALAAQE